MMLKKLRQQIAAEFPEYVELNHLLNLASITWPRYGINPIELAKMDEMTREMIELRILNGD